MAKLANRVREVYASEGGMELARRSTSYLSRRVKRSYWQARGQRTKEIRGTEATFLTEGRSARSLEIFDTERTMVADMLSESRSGDVLVDVGANLGYHSCFFGNHVADGFVEAFEPAPIVHRRLERNLDLNGVDGNAHRLALSDTSGSVTLPADVLSKTVESDRTVRTATADELVAGGEIRQPTIVKIDVEGCEPMVVEGMRNTLSDDRCRLLYCEVHLPGTGPSIEDFGWTRERFESTLAGFGFYLRTIKRRGNELHLKGAKNDTR
ncbi:FkbM family methyltransferase [Halorarum halophilum]|uniref:FkbM family methyltransferase n=1 Tax=Halorarum halophilum TaxID=2743090 RepID=A0A7D5GVK7_9EURY|nr:FkbM family methyltransferase [Halobaculum halophilum]QLG26209.1 FkbM family methyltransferase [Halobaculum halophilum]